MRRDLSLPIPAPILPDGVRLRTLADGDEDTVHALLAQSYRNGGGAIAGFEPWWTALVGDEQFDPALCFLAVDDARILGVAQCWTSAFVKDLAVRDDQRRRGIGRALLLHAFRTFAARGAASIDLKVHDDNAPALALYRGAGMTLAR